MSLLQRHCPHFLYTYSDGYGIRRISCHSLWIPHPGFWKICFYPSRPQLSHWSYLHLSKLKDEANIWSQAGWSLHPSSALSSGGAPGNHSTSPICHSNCEVRRIKPMAQDRGIAGRVDIVSGTWNLILNSNFISSCLHWRPLPSRSIFQSSFRQT